MTTRVLILHDESNDFEVLALELMADGCEVAAVCNANYGLTLARRERPDLILLDPEMRGEAGRSIYDQLRTMPLTRRVPVIFVTGPARQHLSGTFTYVPAEV